MSPNVIASIALLGAGAVIGARARTLEAGEFAAWCLLAGAVLVGLPRW